MDAPLWAQRPLPPPLADQLPAWNWELRQAADLTTSRSDLKVRVLGAGVPPGDIEDDMERLLLAYEELASNGFRHGQAPVRAAVTAAGDGWLIDLLERAGAEGINAPETVRRLSRALMTARDDKTSDDATIFLLEWTGSDGEDDFRLPFPH